MDTSISHPHGQVHFHFVSFVSRAHFTNYISIVTSLEGIIKFCTCHKSTDFIPCAQFYSNKFNVTWMRAERNFCQIWITMEKLLMKWAPDLCLTLKHRETHGCVVSTVATDALVLKHQAISILSTDETLNLLDQFHMKILHPWWTTFGNKITCWKKKHRVV